MCFDPVSMAVISMAATGGGNFLQTKANNSSNKAQMAAKNARMEEGFRQQEQNQADAGAQFNKSLDKFQPQQQQQDLGQLVTKRETALDSNMTPATGVDPTSNIGNAPKIVQGDLAKKLSDAVAYGHQQGNARARVGATGDKFLDNALQLNDSNLGIGTISDFAKGDYRTNVARQMEDYNNAKKAPSMIGQLLSTAGSALAMPGVGPGLGTAASNAGSWWNGLGAGPQLPWQTPNNLPWGGGTQLPWQQATQGPSFFS